MSYIGYRIRRERITRDRLESIVDRLESESRGHEQIGSNPLDYTEEIEKILATGNEMDMFEDPVKYEFEEGNPYAGISPDGWFICGDENVLEDKCYTAVRHGVRFSPL